jgi:hypothetical protein
VGDDRTAGTIVLFVTRTIVVTVGVVTGAGSGGDDETVGTIILSGKRTIVVTVRVVEEGRGDDVTVSTIVLSVRKTIVVTVWVVTAVGFILVNCMTIGTGIQIYQSRTLGNTSPAPVVRTAGGDDITVGTIILFVTRMIVATVGVVAPIPRQWRPVVPTTIFEIVDRHLMNPLVVKNIPSVRIGIGGPIGGTALGGSGRKGLVLTEFFRWATTNPGFLGGTARAIGAITIRCHPSRGTFGAFGVKGVHRRILRVSKSDEK